MKKEMLIGLGMVLVGLVIFYGVSGILSINHLTDCIDLAEEEMWKGSEKCIEELENKWYHQIFSVGYQVDSGNNTK